jgi:fructokinase
MISRVGNDLPGAEIRKIFEETVAEGVLQVDASHNTGTVNVQVDGNGIPSFDIVDDVAYDYIEYDTAVQHAMEKKPTMVYFGTLAQRNRVSRSTLQRIVDQSPLSILLYDMNLRQNYYSQEIIESSLRACDVVKLNDEELSICKTLFHHQWDDRSFVHWLMERFDLQWFSLTRGEAGSELYPPSGQCVTGSVPEQEIVDTVGAGDAYTAVLALGILNQWPPDTILNRATLFAGAICAQKGAIPEKRAFYAPYLHWTE